MARKKYKIISEDLQKSLVNFLDEIQFDAAGNISDKESMQIVNFCSWAIEELLNSYDGYLKDTSTGNKKSPKKKSRDDYVEETFMDWNLPEMDDEEYEKLVDQFDAFLRSWEKEYNKNNPKKKIEERPYKPNVNNIMGDCSLEEIEEFLKDDPELTDEERFELYYDEREKRKPKPKEKGLTYNQLLKSAGIKNTRKK